MYNSQKRNIRKLFWFIGGLIICIILSWFFEMFAYSKWKSIEGINIASVIIPSFETGITMIFIVVTAFIMWFVREQEYSSSAWRFWIEDLDVEGIEQTVIMLNKCKRELEDERDRTKASFSDSLKGRGK